MNRFNFFIIGSIIILTVVVASAVPLKIHSSELDHNEQVIMSNGGNQFTFKPGGRLTVQYGGKTYEYASLSNVDFFEGGTSITKEPQIIFGDDGLIKEAYFTTGKEGMYFLGNEVVSLSAGSKVVFKDGKAMIRISEEEFKPPTVIQGQKGQSSFTYFSSSINGIKLSQYYIKGGLGWENGMHFIQLQDKLELADIVIANPNHVKTFIDFSGKINFAYPGAYISLDRTNGILATGTNTNTDGPALMIAKDNAYGLRFDNDKDHFAFKALAHPAGSYVILKKSSEAGVVPEIEHLNDFVMNQDDKSIFYSSSTGNLYIYPNGRLIKDFGEGGGSSTVAMTLTQSFNTNKGVIDRTIGDFVVGISNYNEIGVGRNKRFIRLHHYPRNPAFYTGISDIEGYNYDLTEAGFERQTGIQLVGADAAGMAYVSKPQNIRYLYDLLGSIPIEQTHMVKKIYFHSGFGNYYAITYSRDMSVHMTVGEGATSSGNALSAAVWRHEMGHIIDFHGGNNGLFDRMWYNSGIDDNVIISNYAHTSGERISEFVGDLAYLSNDGIKQTLGNNWQNNKWYRAAFAVVWYNHGFTYQRIGEIFGGVGLPYDVNSLYSYMREVGIRI